MNRFPPTHVKRSEGVRMMKTAMYILIIAVTVSACLGAVGRRNKARTVDSDGYSRAVSIAYAAGRGLQ